MVEVDIAITRTDQNNRRGDGRIGTVHIILKDSLAGGTGTLYDVLNLGIKDEVFIDSVGNQFVIPSIGDSVVVRQVEVGALSPAGHQSLKVFPNPANKSFRILHSDGLSFKLTDLPGRMLVDGQLHSNLMSIDVSHLPNGIYFLKVEFDKGQVIKKLLIQR